MKILDEKNGFFLMFQAKNISYLLNAVKIIFLFLPNTQ